MKTNAAATELVIIAPWLIAGLYVSSVWSQLPIDMPTHYDLSGRPDGWKSKEGMALQCAAIAIVVYLIVRFLPKIDPKKRLQSSHFQHLRFVLMLLLAVTLAGVFHLALSQSGNPSFMGPELAIVSLLIAGVGNYVTTIKPNWFVGIRTPWTLKSDDVWRKTHRMGGRLLVTGGLLGALLALTVPAPYTFRAVFGMIAVVSIIPIVYSYIFFRQGKAHQLN